MRLIEILEIQGVIVLQSGLHIGAGKDRVEIGGLDNPIIKNSLTNAPYIPGSSLKGKMRSLLEASRIGFCDETRKDYMQGLPCGCGKKSCPICVVFGASTTSNEVKAKLGPTRLLVRDSQLAPEDETLFKNGDLRMEIKYENSINRCTGKANPRPLERVPAGVSFRLSMALRKYDEDQEDYLSFLLKGLKLVELDALGGCGSRGCGETRFRNIAVNNELKYENLDNINPFEGEKNA